MHLGDDHCIGIVLRNPTVTLEHIQHWEIGYSPTIGNARPSEIGHPLLLKTAAELIQQSRFTHPRFANDTDHLSPPHFSRLQERMESRQFALPPHEAGQLARLCRRMRARL